MSFCVMPWIGLEINNNGNLRPCCAWTSDAITDENGDKFNINTHSISEYHDSPRLDAIRQAMLAGEKIPECQKCYREESVGIRSMRVRKNRIFPTDVEHEHGLKSVDIKLSNLCNQKCMICNATASSMVASENKTLFPELMSTFRYDDFNWYKNDERWTELKELSNTVQHLDFYGGEPWLIKKQWEFIRYLVETGASKHISLNYATNGSVFDEKWFTEYFPEFQRVTILFSADGTQETFEYARHPAEWSVFEHNVKRISEYRDSGVIDWIGIAYTVSAFSIHNVIDSLEIYRDMGIPVWFNMVNEDEFRAAVLPDSVKADISQHIHDNWQSDFLLSDDIGPEFFQSELDRDIDPVWRDVFRSKTLARDQYRDHRLESVLPQIAEWLHEK